MVHLLGEVKVSNVPVRIGLAYNPSYLAGLPNCSELLIGIQERGFPFDSICSFDLPLLWGCSFGRGIFLPFPKNPIPLMGITILQLPPLKGEGITVILL